MPYFFSTFHTPSMAETFLLHDLIRASAERSPAQAALVYGQQRLNYAELQSAVVAFSASLIDIGLARGDRVGIYLEKRPETVIASFGAPAAGGVFVPLNPLLKAEQVMFILRDCDVRVLVTSPDRLALLLPVLSQCPALRYVVLTDTPAAPPMLPAGMSWSPWSQCMGAVPRVGHRLIDTDLVSILYTSGSTGKPKGVVLSHRNMVAGAKSVASYLENNANDTLLAALPLQTQRRSGHSALQDRKSVV